MSDSKIQSAPTANRLLAALPAKEYERLLPKLNQIPLIYSENIYEPGEVVRYVYFPTSGIISLLAVVEKHSTLEVGIVGNEGVVGLSVFFGVETSNSRALVQGTGAAMRMKATDFYKESLKGGALTRILQRYTHSLLTQVSQSAVCYRFHLVEARLARWLLMMHDRMERDEFKITQEFLSNMLGVRREAVNKAASAFQQKEIISYNRGNVAVNNRAKLEAAACDCYNIIRNEEKSFPAQLKTKK